MPVLVWSIENLAHATAVHHGPGLGRVAGPPLDAVPGEPGAVLRGKIAGRGGAWLRCDPQSAGATDVGRPFVAALEHDLLERGWPAEQQPPAALGA
jgi:hypothetical protein